MIDMSDADGLYRGRSGRRVADVLHRPQAHRRWQAREAHARLHSRDVCAVLLASLADDELSNHLDKSRTLMIGDRLDTDILFGANGGIDTLLVLTGPSRSPVTYADVRRGASAQGL